MGLEDSGKNGEIAKNISLCDLSCFKPRCLSVKLYFLIPYTEPQENKASNRLINAIWC